MVYDNDSTLFLGSRGGYGVIRFNIFNQGYEFLQTNNLRNPAIGDVLSVCQTKDSTFYAGASSGLTRIKFRGGKMRLRQFDKSDGIVNDMIHGIHEGNDSCIWLSTNKGLTKYNPRNNFSIIIISLTLASRNSLMTLIGNAHTPSVYSLEASTD